MNAFEGIIIRQINYKESSKILHVYTPEGMISLLVQGAKKLNSPFLTVTDTFNHIRGFYSGKGLFRLVEADSIHTYDKIKSDLIKVSYVTHLSELIITFSESNYDHEKFYLFFLKVLDKMDSESVFIPYCYMFESKYLSLLGVAPQWKHCVICRSQDNLRFSVSNGGMMCLTHYPQNETPYSSEGVQLLSQLYYFDIGNAFQLSISEENVQSIRHLLDDYYEYHLGFQSKSRKVLSGLLGY